MPTPKNISSISKRLIIFDFDGVLVDVDVARSEMFASALANMGCSISPQKMLQKMTGPTKRR